MVVLCLLKKIYDDRNDEIRMLFTCYTEIYTAEWEADRTFRTFEVLQHWLLASEAKCSQNNQLPLRLMFTVQQRFNEAAMKL